MASTKHRGAAGIIHLLANPLRPVYRSVSDAMNDVGIDPSRAEHYEHALHQRLIDMGTELDWASPYTVFAAAHGWALKDAYHVDVYAEDALVRRMDRILWQELTGQNPLDGSMPTTEDGQPYDHLERIGLS